METYTHTPFIELLEFLSQEAMMGGAALKTLVICITLF